MGIRRDLELLTTSIGPHRATDRWSYPDFIDLRNARTGVSMTGWATGRSEVTLPASAGGPKTSAETMFVSADYFATFGVALARKPGFQETPDPVVILGYTFWQKRLAADPDIVGSTLVLNGVPHLVAGIAPEQFGGHLPFEDQGAQLFLPLERPPTLLADLEEALFGAGRRVPSEATRPIGVVVAILLRHRLVARRARPPTSRFSL